MTEKINSEITHLKVKIEAQRKQNIELYKSIPVASHEDPLNKNAEPFLVAWREGSNKLKRMLDELGKLESESRAKTSSKVNIASKAAERYITCTTYENALKCTEKAILSFLS